MKDLVSIVVPFYNEEKYLDRCILSVLSQKYKDIQLILIDNNSSDQSLQVAKRYLDDNRVIVKTCMEKGVSNARNLGIQMAQGKWILFVDADDYLDKCMIENMIHVSNQKINKLVCVETGYCIEKVSNKITEDRDKKFYKTDFTCKEMLSELFYSSIEQYRGYIWNKLLLMDIIREHELLFDADLFYNEDRLFLCRYFLACRNSGKIVYTPGFMYHYCIHENSAMNIRKQLPLSKQISEIVAFDRMESMLKNEPDAYRVLVNESIIGCYNLLINNNFKKHCKEKEIINDYLRKIRSYNTKTYIKKQICLNSFLLKITSLLTKK